MKSIRCFFFITSLGLTLALGSPVAQIGMMPAQEKLNNSYEPILQQPLAARENLDEPNLENFELVGYLNIGDQQKNQVFTDLNGVQHKALPKYLHNDNTIQDEDDEIQMGILVSGVTGEVYIERYRPPNTDDIEMTHSYSEFDILDENNEIIRHDPWKFGGDETGPYMNEDESNNDSTNNKTVFGSDDRKLVYENASEFPWRAVGVLLVGSGSSGSAAMIGPRHILTAAHVITIGGPIPNIKLKSAYPGARGEGSTLEKFPFGERKIIWYYWPAKYDSTGSTSFQSKYDYAVLILEDINWSPGWVSFGHRYYKETDYKFYHHTGYPGQGFKCAKSPLDTGECGGYMYTSYGEVGAVLANVIFHSIDTVKGQSGAPVYEKNNNTITIYGIDTAGGKNSNIANRITSISYKSICHWVKQWPSSYFSNVKC